MAIQQLSEQEILRRESMTKLRELGITDEYEGIGNCILGYTAGDYPEAKPRKENWVYWVK